MYWTKEAPKEKGQYWWRSPYLHEKEIIEVEFGEDGALYIIASQVEDKVLGPYGQLQGRYPESQFAGPIPEPMEVPGFLFKVLNNGKPARYPDFNVDPSWGNNQFYTLYSAIDYASRWLGQFGPFPMEAADTLTETPMPASISYKYSSAGDELTITKEKLSETI